MAILLSGENKANQSTSGDKMRAPTPLFCPLPLESLVFKTGKENCFVGNMELKQIRRRRKRERHLKMWLRVCAIIFQLFKLIMLEKMCSYYPGIKLEPARGT